MRLRMQPFDQDDWSRPYPRITAQQALAAFAAELKLPSREEARRTDLMELLLELNAAVYGAIEYVPKSTRVDSPADDALRNRQGVCQDYAHIVIALVRQLGIPCRYVSGYLFHREGVKTRSAEGATHAWVEAYLGDLGWVAFDPTNNLQGCERHIRVAVGRDYADVPPTRGVYKGDASSELSVMVAVSPMDAPEPEELPPTTVIRSKPLSAETMAEFAQQQQQQQQQQQ